MQFLPPSRAIAHFGSANCPIAYQGLKIITSLSLRFPDFQRLMGGEIWVESVPDEGTTFSFSANFGKAEDHLQPLQINTLEHLNVLVVDDNKQARHATSRNSGTPVTLIRSPTQRMGDALNALRP